MSRRRRWAGAACLVLIANGCGTTLRSPGTANSNVGLAASPTSALVPATASPDATSTGPVATTPPGSAASLPDQSTTLDAGGAESSTSVAATPPGGSVLIGFATEKDISVFASTLGVSGVDGGDIEGQLHAVVDDINAHGGLSGHKIVAVEHNINTQDRASNPAGVAQAACVDWTEDHHVVAVVDSYVGLAGLPGMTDCLAKAGVPLVSDWGTDDSNSTAYASHPLLASPSSMTVDQYIPAEIDRLYANGFFTGWDTSAGKPGSAPVKIGAQSFDDTAGQHYVDVLRAALARHGLKLDAVESHSRGPTAAAAGSSSAVLKFGSQGITHVFFANILFYVDAQTQGYHPRYNVDDLIGPALLAQNVGATQLHGAMGSGYQPLDEVAGAADPSAASAHCLAVMHAAGQIPSANLARVSMFEMCSHWYLLQQIFAHATAVNAASFRAGLDGLGTTFSSAATYGTMFGPTRHFGAEDLRDYAYTDGCKCFTFTSTQLHPVG